MKLKQRWESMAIMITFGIITPSAILPSPSSAAVSVTPVLRASEHLQMTSLVYGTADTSGTWSISPNVGTISSRGMYTAPSSITSVQTITAICVFNTGQSGTAAITLRPTVTLSISPTQATMTPSQSQQFQPVLTGATDASVVWSISPAIGTITAAGLYTAPASIDASQTISVFARSVADPDSSAAAVITLKPLVKTVVSPQSATLTAAQTQQFTSTLTGSSNPAVAWSLSPALGSITATGVYTAPLSINAVQNVIVTATSVVDPTSVGSATVTLQPVVTVSASPQQAAVLPGQSTQFSAAVSGTLNPAVTWSISPTLGTISAAGLYTAPTSISGNQTITVIATSVADSTKSASAIVTISSPKILLPIEIAGPNGTIESVVVNIPPGANLGGSQKIWLQAHSLRYANKASVQVNNSPWIDINDGTVTYLDASLKWGGIGGGFSTHKMTVNVPDGTVVPGNNTIRFRFNRTAGGVGFRILKLNLVGSDGSMLLSQDMFQEDDPNTWQPPLTSPDDIAAGKQLLQTAPILHGGVPVKAHCADCHTQDGRDFHYFNYSNKFIHAAAVISGLTAQQGDQIASYIRSINFPNPGRPWNPLYQPGPGMDSRPVSDWAAGAGIDAVLDQDADMFPYLMPGGSTANWAWNSYLNAREMPIPLQLLDWNHWLPTTHPVDAWGSAFTNSSLNAAYLKARSLLVPNDPASYKAAAFTIWTLGGGAPGFQPVMFASPNWNDPTYVQKVESVSQWSMVKLWELNQEFGLEGMAKSIFGPQSADRAWDTTEAFGSSPTFAKIPRPSPGLENGTTQVHVYLSFVWYQLQLILNDGNGMASGSTPIDWGYSLSYTQNDLTWDPQAGPRVGTAGLMLEWLSKALQSGLTAGGGNASNPYGLVVFPGQVGAWRDISPAQKVSLMNAWVSTWLDRYQQLTLQQLLVTHQAWPTVDFTQKSIETDLAKALPQLRFQGVDISLLNRAVSWASSIWPNYNWNGALNAPCSVYNLGEVKCTVPLR